MQIPVLSYYQTLGCDEVFHPHQCLLLPDISLTSKLLKFFTLTTVNVFDCQTEVRGSNPQYTQKEVSRYQSTMNRNFYRPSASSRSPTEKLPLYHRALEAQKIQKNIPRTLEQRTRRKPGEKMVILYSLIVLYIDLCVNVRLSRLLWRVQCVRLLSSYHRQQRTLIRATNFWRKWVS